MENKKVSTFKVIMTVIFSILVAGALFMYIYGEKVFPAEWNLKASYFKFGCICASFLFALIFIRLSSQKILISMALACTVAADYFLVICDYAVGNNQLIGLSLFIAAQFFYMLYTFVVAKAKIRVIISLALRLALILVIYIVLPKQIELTMIQALALVYIANSAVTWISLMISIKSQWLMSIGFLLFTACDVILGLKMGGFDVLNWTGKVVDFLMSHDIETYCYIPGIFLISAASVWNDD